MKKYRLRCDTVLYPKGTIANYNKYEQCYYLCSPNWQIMNVDSMAAWQIEGNSLWEEILEENLISTNKEEIKLRCKECGRVGSVEYVLSCLENHIQDYIRPPLAVPNLDTIVRMVIRT